MFGLEEKFKEKFKAFANALTDRAVEIARNRDTHWEARALVLGDIAAVIIVVLGGE